MSAAFKELVALFEQHVGRCQVMHFLHYEYLPNRNDSGLVVPARCMTKVPDNDVEGLLHEWCHQAVAMPHQLLEKNYGLLDAHDDDCEMVRFAGRPQSERVCSCRYAVSVVQEMMCGWAEDFLYSLGPWARPQSSVDEIGYQTRPDLKQPAEEAWNTKFGHVTEEVRRCMALDGAGVGRWHG